MQAVILAAGRGTRLRPITYDIPKPMIKINGKNLMEYNLDKLPAEVDEIIMIVGYLAPKIMSHFGNEFNGRKIKYIKQEKKNGTGGALWLAKEQLDKRFIVMMGDDIYSKEDINKCLKHERCVLANEIQGNFAGGRLKLDTNGNLEDIVEGIHKKGKSLVNAAFYVLTNDIFKYDLVPLPGGKEYGLPQTMIKMAKEYPVKIERASFWLQINDVAGLNHAKKILKSKYGKI